VETEDDELVLDVSVLPVRLLVFFVELDMELDPVSVVLTPLLLI
jgi:hypothetical protein